MKKKQDKQVEGEEPITMEEDAPPWEAGIEEAKEIMAACLKAAQEVYKKNYPEAGMTATGKPNEVFIGEIGVRKFSDVRQDIANMAIAMYQSIVMMELERGRIDAIRSQRLSPGLEMPVAPFFRKP